MVDLLGTVRFSQAHAFRSSRACQHLKQTVRLLPTNAYANARQKASRRGTTVSVQSLFGWGNSQVVENDFGVEYDGRVTVAKLQVGLSGSAREIQTDLEHLAAHADTDTPEGLHAVLQETVLALMRNPEYCLYAYSTGAALGDPDRAEQRFNQYSVEERSKFKTETRVNVDGMSRRGELQKSAVGLGGPEELIVVTILVAADGAFKLPKITSRNELRTALSRLGSLVPDDVMAVEVLWTPEEEGDYFTVEDLAMDYPLLNTL